MKLTGIITPSNLGSINLVNELLDSHGLDIIELLVQGMAGLQVENAILKHDSKSGKHSLQHFLRQEWVEQRVGWEFGDLTSLQLLDRVVLDCELGSRDTLHNPDEIVQSHFITNNI